MGKLKLYIVAFAVALFAVHSAAYAQAIKTRIDRTKIRIGEQIKLELVVEGARTTPAWFQFPDSVNHIEVVSRSKIDTAISAGHIVYKQVVTLTSFDSGRWEFPPLAIAGIPQVTSPFYIDVMSVDVSKLKDYNDIHEIEEVEPESNWLLIAIIIAAALVLAAIIWWLIKRRKKKPKAVIQTNLSPLEWALAELKKLDRSALQSPAEVKRFYSELTRISRTYFNMQLQQGALHKTTDEWMTALQPLEVDSNIKTSFFQVLRLADAVKFAKYIPASAEHTASVEALQAMFEKVALLHSQLYAKYQPGGSGQMADGSGQAKDKSGKAFNGKKETKKEQQETTR